MIRYREELEGLQHGRTDRGMDGMLHRAQIKAFLVNGSDFGHKYRHKCVVYWQEACWRIWSRTRENLSLAFILSDKPTSLRPGPSEGSEKKAISFYTEENVG